MNAPAAKEDFGPYLSVVLAARNGSDEVLRRLNLTVESWLAHSQRTGLALEIIVVEWNPDAARSGLEKCLPAGQGACRVGVVTVSPEVHQAFPGSECCDLFEHLALNVGIVRAKGRFVLATRSGVLPSVELADFLAQQRLLAGTLYRCDGWQVPLPEKDDGFDPASQPVHKVFRRRETLDLKTQRVVLNYQRPLAIWWETLNPILNFTIFFLDALPDLFRQVLERFKASRKRAQSSYVAEVKLLLRNLLRTPVFIFDKGIYQFRVRRMTWLYFWPCHVNACGDFILMECSLWQRLRGFPEFHGSAQNTDVAFLLSALSAKDARECGLAWPKRVFKLASSEADVATTPPGLPAMDFLAAAKMADERRCQASPGPLNGEEWGLGSLMLRERFLKGAA